MTGRSGIRIGDHVPAFARVPGFAEWNRFAAVNHEFVPIHMDDDEGRKAGYDRAIGMGRLQWAYVHLMLRQWLGDDGRIVRVALQFRSPNLRGEPVVAGATVTALRTVNQRQMVDLAVRVEDSAGRVLAPGTATVELS